MDQLSWLARNCYPCRGAFYITHSGRPSSLVYASLTNTITATIITTSPIKTTTTTTTTIICIIPPLMMSCASGILWVSWAVTSTNWKNCYNLLCSYIVRYIYLYIYNLLMLLCQVCARKCPPGYKQKRTLMKNWFDEVLQRRYWARLKGNVFARGARFRLF